MMRQILRTLGGVLLACGLALAGYNGRQDAAAERASQTLVRCYTAPTVSDAQPDTTQGVLELPTLGLTLPVQPTCTPSTLQNGPCRQFGSAAQGDLVVAGHNYRSQFGRLDRLCAGDAVVFTAGDAVYAYTVQTLRTVPPDTDLQGEAPLVLYTCTYSGAERLAVFCDRQG